MGLSQVLNRVHVAVWRLDEMVITDLVSAIWSMDLSWLVLYSLEVILVIGLQQAVCAQVMCQICWLCLSHQILLFTRYDVSRSIEWTSFNWIAVLLATAAEDKDFITSAVFLVTVAWLFKLIRISSWREGLFVSRFGVFRWNERLILLWVMLWGRCYIFVRYCPLFRSISLFQIPFLMSFNRLTLVKIFRGFTRI